MKEEDKDLFTRDLCARLPYKVEINVNIENSINNNYNNFNDNLVSIDVINGIINDEYDIEDIKPYLFSISSMTEEQKKELASIISCDAVYDLGIEYETFDLSGLVISFDVLTHIINYFNSNHLDYNRLIDKGLAIDATNLNIY